MNEPIAPSIAPAAVAPTAAPTVPMFVEPSSHAGITDAQGTQIVRDIQKDLATGKISQVVADARFDEMNTPMDQRVMPLDNRTDEQKLIDDHFPPAQGKRFPHSVLPPWTRAAGHTERATGV